MFSAEHKPISISGEITMADNFINHFDFVTTADVPELAVDAYTHLFSSPAGITT